jgi:hypothetical protein
MTKKIEKFILALEDDTTLSFDLSQVFVLNRQPPVSKERLTLYVMGINNKELGMVVYFSDSHKEINKIEILCSRKSNENDEAMIVQNKIKTARPTLMVEIRYQ